MSEDRSRFFTLTFLGFSALIA
ncbi:MAG TPA: signal peptidase II, partial [Marinobacter hydrocarbonoclasticus]|nr:signal peptidase II [Marinobacter nauticus]